MTLCLTVVCGLVRVALLFVCVFQHLSGTSRLVDFSEGDGRNARKQEPCFSHSFFRDSLISPPALHALQGLSSLLGEKIKLNET